MTEQFKYFKLEDFNCQETGDNLMDVAFIHRLDELREACDFPFVITSGYRSKDHSIEKKKTSPGTHAQGIAADIKVSGGFQRYKIVEKALLMGFRGVGIAKTFIHIDDRQTGFVIWNY